MSEQRGAIPPHSPQAEKAFVGACLLWTESRDLLVKELDPSDFYLPKYRDVAEAIAALHRVGAGVDPVTVANWIVEHYGTVRLEQVGGVAALIETQADAPSRSSAATHAHTVRDRAARRQMLAALFESRQAVDDLAVPATDVLDDLMGRFARVDVPLLTNPTSNAFEFLDRNMDYRWLIPGWLERQDRAIITGTEGAGKSIVLRQMAVQMAAGIHPWRRERPEPVNVLLLDFENSERQVWRRLHYLIEMVATSARQLKLGEEPPIVFDPDRLRVEARPSGVNLLNRADRRWFTGKVAASKPDIIVTGPLYKLHAGNVKDEEPANEIAGYFDQLRAEYDVALMLEAHSPLGNDGGSRRTLRPIGSGLWIRWPEFGYGLRRTDDAGIYEFEAWRPPRDDNRSWPSRVRRGVGWPWVNDHLILEDEMEPAF